MRLAVRGQGVPRQSWGRWGGGLGYLLYTLFAAGLSLWLLFPEESLQRLLIRSLNGLIPGVQWRLESLSLHLPLTLRVENVAGYLESDVAKPALQVDWLEIRPDLGTSVKKRGPWLSYHLQIGPGTIAGSVGQQGQKKGYAFHGRVHSLHLRDFPLLAQRLERNVQGEISASYEGEMSLAGGAPCHWKAQTKIEHGRLALVRPVLHHTVFPFSRVTMLLHGAGPKMTVAEGKIVSPLGDGWFNGLLGLQTDPAMSELDLRGGLHPKPAFFQGVEKTVALQSVQVALQEKSLPFSLSGTLLHPGLHFEDFALQISALNKEMR